MEKSALRIAFVLFALILALACTCSIAGAEPQSFALDGSSYEYHGRVIGTLYMLWREL